MNENLENKVCLITGATNGIGLEAAKALNQMGAEIVFIARNHEKANKLKEELLQESGRQPTAIIADLSSQNEVKKAAEEFLSLNKPLDILLNNAVFFRLKILKVHFIYKPICWGRKNCKCRLHGI